MSTLCRFVIPSTLSSVEDACVTEFNEYKKRMKELAQQKSTTKRSTSSIGGLLGTASHSHESSHHHQKDAIRNPEQAKEAAKKLVQSGAIKVLAQGKDQGFKRASSSTNPADRLNKKMALTPNTASPSTAFHSNPFQPVPFVSPSSTSKSSSTSSSNEIKRRVVNYDDTDNY